MTDLENRLPKRETFLSRLELLVDAGPELLDHVASVAVDRTVRAGQVVLVEGGSPGEFLYAVRQGSLELLHNEVIVDLVAPGQVFGHPTLLTGLAPEFTVRAREDSTLVCIPKDLAIDLLSRPAGVRFVARTLRDRLLLASRAMRAIPDIRLRPINSLLHGEPVFCTPDTTIGDAARLMRDQSLTALLVRTRDGLGIVTDVDMRDKVIAASLQHDAPVSSIMSTPVRTVNADTPAAQASIEMMEARVNHLPVVGRNGRVVGVLSASSLMALDALSPFALRRAVYAARSEDELNQIFADVPTLFVDLLDARLDSMSLTRVITALSDALTQRLLELAFDRHGRPPVDYAWLALGSSARTELTLASDQDNALAYADCDDVAIDETFRRVAEDVNNGLLRCGFALDQSGVLASNRDWRMAESDWMAVFTRCLRGWDSDRLLRASIAFDFRQVAGNLPVVLHLTNVIRDAPRHARFLNGLAELGAEIPSPLQGLRRRLLGPIDIKRSGLLPIQNMARYYAFSKGITALTSRERLLAVRDTGQHGGEAEHSLSDAFETMCLLRLRHHGNAIRNGRAPDNAIDTAALRPLTRLNLQEAFRVVAAAQRRLPQQVGPGW